MIEVIVSENASAGKYEIEMMKLYEDRIFKVFNKARRLDIPNKDLKWVMSSDLAEVICLCSEINSPVSHWKEYREGWRFTVFETYHGIEVEKIENYDSDCVLELALKEVQDGM